MITLLKSFWYWLSNLGVSPEHIDENELIRGYNRMSFILLLCSTSFVASISSMDVSFAYKMVAAASQLTYPVIVLLHYFGKIYAARMTFSIMSTTWSCVTFICIGGNFGLELTVCIDMLMTFVALKKKPQIRYIVIIGQLLFYLYATVFVAQVGTIFTPIDFPLDEIIVFFSCIGWMIVVLSSHAKSTRLLLDQLTERNRALKTTSDELEKFTYIASHDLKSPLRTITSFVGLAKRKLDKERYEEAKEDLDYIKNSAAQMTHLVDSILEYAKLNNKNDDELKFINLNEIFSQSKKHISTAIKEKNARIIADDLPVFYCHKFDMLRIFQNFLENGIKYNESAVPEVHVSSNVINDQLHIYFKDNGIGIPEEYYDYIFQFFKRLHNSEKYTGSGMGLGIVHKIITSYGGTVEIKSKIGVGTTFDISLPYKSRLAISETKTQENIEPPSKTQGITKVEEALV